MLREFEAKQANERQMADAFLQAIHPVCINALERKGVLERHRVGALSAFLANDLSMSLDRWNLIPREYSRQWTVSYPVDLNDEQVNVTLRGYGGKGCVTGKRTDIKKLSQRKVEFYPSVFFWVGRASQEDRYQPQK